MEWPDEQQQQVAAQVPEHQSAPQQEPTNTLILSNLPVEFFVPSICSALLSLLHAYGSLVRWNPMPSVGRALIVFEEAQGAQRAKEGLDRLLLPFEEGDASRDDDRPQRAAPDAGMDE